MKRSAIVYLCLAFLISSCGLGKVDKDKGIAVAEGLLNDLKTENYTDIDKYYMNSFNASEPLDRKVAKFKRLREVMGPIQSFQLKDAKEEYDSVKGINQLLLTYSLVCTKVTATQTFLIINDEGDMKIMFQNIENLK
jgi:hypothetical protein